MKIILGSAIVIFLAYKTFGLKDKEIYEYVLGSSIGEPIYVPQDTVIISNSVNIKGSLKLFFSQKEHKISINMFIILR